ncbi:flagellar biosynthesis regulator FlaF [Rhodobacter capsulatus]|uniref:Flagellar biosynthesis regulator FlaF n=1 Tax=Rhodobacter capsulatus TaxID=1061 RepID=A0A4V5PUL3_RHOCA|nr:flagellar biosynthesis regulator FlaF [Rhodobacter capsulatus]KQB14580.1 flagellar biosynthesis regulator FlhF [Rhodobacter capsulatus]KQB14879.1 flagellar biosynthesis regulator FlhF [Rhodobacter capsulatus]PZX25034.1 flagellar protein FlaF [Rhodobacter capsulatus]QNR63257.1 flagellar biosynthesis regulator FlaF [Rhodobacter capsulatus]TKD26122.1 flagellar biosynthesis regulator FlaF [Rhodobacter capsulatus]
MNATILAKTAYANPGQPTRTLRGTEYEIFARVTHRLKQAAGLEKSNFPAVVRALYDNRRLWTTLAVDVALPDNELPDTLRARIFYLNQFTQAHSAKVLKGEASVDVLIDINTAIMRGLRREGGAE